MVCQRYHWCCRSSFVSVDRLCTTTCSCACANARLMCCRRRYRMHAYIHWDVDLFLDSATTNRTVNLIRRYEGSAIRGVFQLASDPLGNKSSPTFVGSIPVFKPIYQYGPANATAAAAAINSVPPGSEPRKLAVCWLSSICLLPSSVCASSEPRPV